MKTITTKTEAIAYFGNMSRIGEILDITPQAVQQWPEILTRPMRDRVELAMIKMQAIKDAQANS